MCVTRISLSVWCPFAPFCFRVSRSLSFYVTRDILQFGKRSPLGQGAQTHRGSDTKTEKGSKTNKGSMDGSVISSVFFLNSFPFSSPFCPFSPHYSSLRSYEKNGDERSYDTICLWQQLMTGKKERETDCLHERGKWWVEKRRVTTAQHAMPYMLVVFLLLRLPITLGTGEKSPRLITMIIIPCVIPNVASLVPFLTMNTKNVTLEHLHYGSYSE